MAAIQSQHLTSHPTKRAVLFRFIALILILGLYIGYLSLKFNLRTAGWLGIVTWSMFVLSTPIADAGFLLDFPMRVLFSIRMTYSEIMVWVIAFTVNITTLITNPGLYDKTALTSVFKFILTHPWPYWSIVVISAVGTFLSVHFGDELLDIVHFKQRKKYEKHKNKYALVVWLFMMVLIVVVYKHMMKGLM
ncbi:MAG: hypothetical protein GXP43_03265 [bacterium]|nr:hypothetical protein [bacterium]